jgi:hypothetical protein
LFATVIRKNDFANLMPALGRQDHTALPSALAPFVNGTVSVHRISPRVRDDREPPLWRNGMGRDKKVIWVRWEAKNGAAAFSPEVEATGLVVVVVVVMMMIQLPARVTFLHGCKCGIFTGKEGIAHTGSVPTRQHRVALLHGVVTAASHVGIVEAAELSGLRGR